MAVYTQVADKQIALFLKQHYNAHLNSVQPIQAGTENSNYLLQATQYDKHCYFVLTLFESISTQQLQSCLKFTQHLAQADFAIPAALSDIHGQVLHFLANKPCILTPFINGQHPDQPNTLQCSAIAHSLANIHQQAPQFISEFTFVPLLPTLKKYYIALKETLTADDHQLLKTELQYYQTIDAQLAALPSGIIHNDLFRDNALFQQDELQAILDFYSAQHSFFIYDLAIVINDWCFDNTYKFLSNNQQALLQSYQYIRPLNALELELLPALLRMAACRFWLSRRHLQPQLRHVSASVRATKNPEQYRQRLLFHIAQMN